MLKRHGRKGQGGFTLIELLVVVGIIAVLSSVVLSSLNTARSRGRDTKRFADLRQVQNAIALYISNTGVAPGTGANWWAQLRNGTCSAPGPLAQLTAAYIPSLPEDPLASGAMPAGCPAAATANYWYWYGKGYKYDAANGITNTGSNVGYVICTKLENQTVNYHVIVAPNSTGNVNYCVNGG